MIRFRFSDSTAKKKTQGRKPFEVNIRMVIAFREIGLGFEGIKNFSRCMNIHSFAKLPFQRTNSQAGLAYHQVAKASMKRAAAEVSDEGDEPTKKRVKIDGAWQRRGYASLNGYVSAVVNDKCVDYKAFSKFCMGCRMWEGKENSPRYAAWKAKHNCSINHTKSSGSMEAAGAIKIFSRSVEKNNLIYSHYLGDGDTNSFKDVLQSEPYKAYNVEPVKLECVGHNKNVWVLDCENLSRGIRVPQHLSVVEIN